MNQFAVCENVNGISAPKSLIYFYDLQGLLYGYESWAFVTLYIKTLKLTLPTFWFCSVTVIRQPKSEPKSVKYVQKFWHFETIFVLLKSNKSFKKFIEEFCCHLQIKFWQKTNKIDSHDFQQHVIQQHISTTCFNNFVF